MRRVPALVKIFTLLLVGFITQTGCSHLPVRERISFNDGWSFNLGDSPGASEVSFDDSGWRRLSLPHDWSIEGTFSDTNRATPGGGALPGGIGWYRKEFNIRGAGAGHHYYVEFDGIYRNSEVWINGHYLGKRPYGYSSFRYDITPWINSSRDENIIAVRVDNSAQPNSRWYSGSGIYRNVWFISTGDLAVDHWGTYVTTPEVSSEEALVRIETRIRNQTGATTSLRLRSSLFDADGKLVATAEDIVPGFSDTVSTITQETMVKNPHLWSDVSPALYRLVTELSANNRVTDIYETTFGIRSFIFSSDSGFILNGRKTKLLGVCNHHDLGCLGAAVNTRAIERQLEILKDMGCNAIRTSHNPPAPELLDLCDRMGFIVMDEAFDMWKKGKTPFDYSLDWDEWYVRDLADFILRDRNHPGVIMWSIGNEIMEQWDSTGISMTKELAAMVHDLDYTRPVTSGCNYPFPANNIIASGALDLIGYNYHDSLYTRFPDVFPGCSFVASETNSGLATRGSYDMPSDVIRTWPARWDQPFREGNADLTCSSYDNCSAPWGSIQEKTWPLIKTHDYLSGMFIWTGFDYLGEPTPYWWPARSSYFGLIDLAGFPKDAYYFYKSEWRDETVLHLFPHWNWEPGQMIDVWAYTNCDSVELFENGRSLGMRHKSADTLHLAWRTQFEEGEIRGVGYRDGIEVMSQVIRTAGEPAAVILEPDRNEIDADGSDLSFVTVTVVDADGVPVPHADNLVRFNLEGDAVIAGVDNGCQTSMESFTASQRRAFNGKCLVVVRAGKRRGTIRLTAESDNLAGATVIIRAK